MRWWGFGAILVVSVAPAWGAPFAWLSHLTVNRVARIDLASHTTTSIVVAHTPFTTAASRDGLRAYTANADQTVSVIDAPSATLLGNIPLDGPPAAIAVRADGARAYVPRTDGQLSVIDTATSTVTATFSFGLSTSVGAIVANADGTRAYVTKSEYPITSVAVIDTVADSFTSDVFLDNGGGFPLGVAVSADGTRVYATVFDVPAVFVVDGTTNLLLGTIPLSMDFGVPQPNGLAVSPDGARVYVTDGSNNRLAVLDVASGTELTSIPVGQSPSVVDVTPDGSRVYVVNTGDSSLTVVDAATDTVIGTVLTVDEFPTAGERFIVPGTTTTTTTSAPPTTSSTTSTIATTSTLGSTSSTSGASTSSSSTSSTIPAPPALSAAALACQKTLALSFKRFGAKAHGVFVSCFQRLLGDVASGNGTTAARTACLTALDPGVATAKISRLRSAARTQILARCTNVAPADLALPCTAAATGIPDTADCVLDAQVGAVARILAAEYGDACGIATAAGVSGFYPALCGAP